MPFAHGTSKVLLPLVRALTTSSCSASAVAVTKPSSGGLFSFGSSRLDVPLNEPLPGLLPVAGGSIPAALAKLEVSTVSEVKVASIGSISPVTSVALIVPGGSSLETSATAGASKVLEALAFKATTERSTFRLTRELEKIGIAHATAGRDSITYAIDTVKLHSAEAVEVLLDSVLNAKLLYHEYRDNTEITKALLAKSLSSPSTVLSEVVHRVAFDGPLGQPLFADPKLLSLDALKEFYASLLKPSGLLLAAVGVEHGELKALAEPLLESAHLPSSPVAIPTSKYAGAPSKYVGGSANVISDSAAQTHVALAFEAKGGLADAKASALAAVTKALLDEGRPAVKYALGPNPLAAFLYSYTSSSLIGVSGSSTPDKASQLIDAVFKKVNTVAAGVSEAQLRLAKQVALGAYKTALASSSTALPLIASSLLASGKFDAAEFASSVEALSAPQVTAYIKELTKSTPTFVTYGGLATLPRLDNLVKRLG